MEPDTCSVELILEAIDAEMEGAQPKALLFDIGGVCVSSRCITLHIAVLFTAKSRSIYVDFLILTDIHRSNHPFKSS